MDLYMWLFESRIFESRILVHGFIWAWVKVSFEIDMGGQKWPFPLSFSDFKSFSSDFFKTTLNHSHLWSLAQIQVLHVYSRFKLRVYSSFIINAFRGPQLSHWCFFSSACRLEAPFFLHTSKYFQSGPNRCTCELTKKSFFEFKIPGGDPREVA